MAFDPDAYLAQTAEFNPDAYLGEPQPATAVEPTEQPQTISDEWAQYADMPLAERALSALRGVPRAGKMALRSALRGAGGAVEFMGTPLKLAIEQATGKPVDLAGTAEQYIEKAGLDLPEPETPTEKIVSKAEEMMAGAALPVGIAQKASQLAKTPVGRDILTTFAAKPGAQLTSAGAAGVSGETAKQMGAGEEAQLAASLAGGLIAPGAPSLLKKGMSPAKAFVNAHKLGYKVPPSLAKPATTQQIVEGGIAGSAATRQKASLHNQQVTNDLIKKDIGYPKDMPLSHEGLDVIRKGAGNAYEQAKAIGVFNADDAYLGSLKKIAQTKSAMAREFPEMVKKDIVDMVKIYGKKQMSSEAVVEAVKQLRADASAGFVSADPAISAMAKAKGQVADAMEKLMERQAKEKAPEIVPALRAARQLIAKTYTIGKALKGENIDARVLGRELDKNKPLSGLSREVGEFGRQFKGAAAVPEGVQPTNFRVTDLMLGAGTSGLTGQPGYMALMAARPALRSAILSKPYQAILARARPKEMQRIMQLPREARAAEMMALYNQLQDSGKIESR